jgi:predicted permease
VSGRLRALVRRLAASFRRRRLDEDLRDELAVHLELAVEEGLRTGLDRAEARRRALVVVGSLDRALEEHREARGLPGVDRVIQDARYAFRTLYRHKRFTSVATTVLALGIGSASAMLALGESVLLRRLPFPNADRLVVLWEDLSATGSAGLTRVEPSAASYAEWKARTRTLEDLAAMERRTYNLTGAGEPEKLVGVRATGNLFALLGLRAVAGRPLLPSDDDPAAGPVLVMSEGLWRRRFGADPKIVGGQVRLDGLPHTVAGVMPDDFRFPDHEATVWVAARFTANERASRGSHCYVLGRMRPGVAIDEVRAEMKAVAGQLAREERETHAGVGVTVTGLQEQLAGSARPTILLLAGAGALVLLIACANVATLLLARASGREGEIAVRRALGAGDRRIWRQLMMECLVLAAASTIAGAAVALGVLRTVSALVPDALAVPSLRLGLSALGIAGGVMFLAVVLFGTVPSLATAQVDPAAALRTGRQRGGRRLGRWSDALVAGEMAMTALLLVMGVILARSYLNVRAIPPGFSSNRLVVAETILPASKYADAVARTSFQRAVLDRVRALPGVEAAGYVNYPPLVLKEGRGYLSIEGRPAPAVESRGRQVVSWRVASAGYLEALQVPLVRGRHLSETDDPSAVPVVVINEAMARLHWPGDDPIGHRLKLGRLESTRPWHTIVGVVGDIRQMGLEASAEPEVYFCLDQPSAPSPFFWPQHLVVRTAGDPLAVVPALRSAVTTVDPDQPLSNARTMDDILGLERSARANQTLWLLLFAAFSLVLAVVGIYAVLSYDISRRSAEIGVRVALGATRRDVTGLVVGRVARTAAAGIALGILAALGITRALAALLFGVDPLDPLTFVAVPAVLLIVSIGAALLPVRRALLIQPQAALQGE